MDDKRQKALDRVTEMVMRGEPLSEDDVQYNLRLARDQLNARILQKVLANTYSRKGLSEYQQTVELKILELENKILSKLQNAVERHERMHKSTDIDGDKEVMEIILKVKPPHDAPDGD